MTSIQTTVPMTEILLFSVETEEAEQDHFQSSEMTQEKRVDLKASLKSYSITIGQKTPPFSQKTGEFVKIATPFFSTTSSYSEPKTVFIHNSLSSHYPSCATVLEQTKMPPMPSKDLQRSNAPQKNADRSVDDTPQPHTPHTSTKTALPQQPHDQKRAIFSHSPSKTVVSKENTGQSVKSLHQQKSEKKEERTSLQLHLRTWTKEETKNWWEKRFSQKEREHGNQQEQDRENHEKEDKRFVISKSRGSFSKNQPCVQNAEPNRAEKINKPLLAPPKLGVFALYFILTKLGILSDGVSNFGYKKEIEHVDSETDAAHKRRLEEIKESIKKEKETERWGVAVKVFSWIASVLGIITGIALIATGVGAIAGAMLIAGGTLQIANQIMELTGGWQKIASLLPGDDSEKKAEVIRWMQIGIAVLCLALSGAGVLFGGYANFGEAMQTAMGVIGGVASMGYGATTIGEGISNFLYKDRLAQVKKFDIQLEHLKHVRKDLMGKVSGGIDRLEKLFEDLARALEFEEELFQADQMIHRR